MLSRLRTVLHHLNHSKSQTARMSTGAIYNSNEACCSIPPVHADYEPKGTYKPYAGIDKAYLTGPEGTGKAVVVVFDIFGYWPQTLQGADILSTALNARVIMPDFFKGSPFPLSKFPPSTDEEKQNLQNFFKTTANLNDRLAELVKVAETLKADGYLKIAAVGYCWGGKVTTVAGNNTVFSAVASVHPAMLSASDAEPLAVPLGLFLSKDENQEEGEKLFQSAGTKSFASKNVYKRYPTVHHGWAAARADLKDPENLKQYQDLYSTLAGFIKNTFE